MDLFCGLYYKHITMVNDNSSIVNECQVSLTDDTRVVIYDRNVFIIQATGLSLFFLLRILSFFLSSLFPFLSQKKELLTELHSIGRLLALSTNIRRGCRWQTVTNALAYCNMKSILTFKSFIVQSSRFFRNFNFNFFTKNMLFDVSIKKLFFFYKKDQNLH
jgi:hypothetical protein